MDKYDYIITGAGAAGLSLLMHLIHSGQLSNNTVLLVDKSDKKTNDRTWCFWETKPGLFEPVVYHRWPLAWFHDGKGSLQHDLHPYEYKLIRGIDFYRFCFEVISACPNVTIVRDQVEKVVGEPGNTYAVAGGKKYHGRYIFNSINFEDLSSAKHFLLQHFKGWTIESDVPKFDPGACTLMDFRVAQHQGNTTFVYVMPFSTTRALVEYTLFSKDLLKDEAYDNSLRDYCKRFLQLSSYTILEAENGVIPMTDFTFPNREGNIVHIGTAGGQTKPSSGYTFRFIQKQSAAIARKMTATGDPFIPQKFSRHRFNMYDRILLHILENHSFPGDRIFSILMRSNPMSRVLQFLDNESSIFTDLKLIRKLPKKIFLRAALK